MLGFGITWPIYLGIDLAPHIWWRSSQIMNHQRNINETVRTKGVWPRIKKRDARQPASGRSEGYKIVFTYATSVIRSCWNNAISPVSWLVFGACHYARPRISDGFYERIARKSPYPIELICKGFGTSPQTQLEGFQN